MRQKIFYLYITYNVACITKCNQYYIKKEEGDPSPHWGKGTITETEMGKNKSTGGKRLCEVQKYID